MKETARKVCYYKIDEQRERVRQIDKERDRERERVKENIYDINVSNMREFE